VAKVFILKRKTSVREGVLFGVIKAMQLHCKRSVFIR